MYVCFFYCYHPVYWQFTMMTQGVTSGTGRLMRVSANNRRARSPRPSGIRIQAAVALISKGGGFWQAAWFICMAAFTQGGKHTVNLSACCLWAPHSSWLSNLRRISVFKKGRAPKQPVFEFELNIKLSGGFMLSRSGGAMLIVKYIFEYIFWIYWIQNILSDYLMSVMPGNYRWCQGHH